MTTPSECFKKQVKSNTCTAFNIFIEGIILGLPIIVFIAYLISLPHTTNIEESFAQLRIVFIGGSIAAIINAIYAYLIAIPFLRCYFGEDL